MRFYDNKKRNKERCERLEIKKTTETGRQTKIINIKRENKNEK